MRREVVEIALGFMTGSVDCLKRGRLTLDDRGRLRRELRERVASVQSRLEAIPVDAKSDAADRETVMDDAG